MVSERAKNQVEDVATAAMEALVSTIPFAGGPAAVILNRAFGSAVQRRNEKIMAQFESDIAELQAMGRAQSSAALIESEEFMAALHVMFRAAQETSSDGKRKFLRNALLNGFVTPEPGPIPPRFVEMTIQYEPEHILVLRELEELAREEMVTHPVTRIRAARERDKQPIPPFFPNFFEELSRDGMVTQRDTSTVKEEMNYDRYGQSEMGSVVKTESVYSISRLGAAFLKFLRDPLIPQPSGADART
jgi:hypothetical protein